MHDVLITGQGIPHGHGIQGLARVGRSRRGTLCPRRFFHRVPAGLLSGLRGTLGSQIGSQRRNDDFTDALGTYANDPVNRWRKSQEKSRAAYLLGRGASQKLAPALNHRDFIGAHHGDPGDQVQDSHQENPPVHALPGGIYSGEKRLDQPGPFRRGRTTSHRFGFSTSSEKGSTSVRRIRLVFCVTIFSRDSRERVNR